MSWFMRVCALLAVLAAGVAACGDQPAEQPAGQPEATDEAVTMRLYTTVTQDTIDAVLEGFAEIAPQVDVEVFRAPTGEFNARVAAEQREGEIQADVFWLTDPLSMLQFDEEGLLAEWQPEAAEEVPAEYRSDTSWGTRLLNMIIVAHSDLEDDAPQSWAELVDVDGSVALPDPGFAGSAFGALGYFALDDDFGMAYYERLADAGAMQVDAPGEVVNAVAEGRAAAGMTLDKAARDADEQGSPIQLIWPDEGAIVIDSPIAVLDDAHQRDAAERFVEHVLSEDGQAAIADTGWEPVRGDVPWDYGEASSVHPAWDEAFRRHDELLEQYRAIFGG